MRMPVRRKANVAPMELPFGRSREPLPTQHTTRTRTQPTAGMARTTQAVETEICFCNFESPRRGSQRGVVAQLSTEKKGEKDISLKMLFLI